ncbi:MAG: hypothetical protein ACI90V_011290, partial [Bacillariaceae sp.]
KIDFLISKKNDANSKSANPQQRSQRLLKTQQRLICERDNETMSLAFLQILLCQLTSQENRQQLLILYKK